MAGKVRVSAIAKELGQSSKDVIAKLNELGEFVLAHGRAVRPRHEDRTHTLTIRVERDERPIR